MLLKRPASQDIGENRHWRDQGSQCWTQTGCWMAVGKACQFSSLLLAKQPRLNQAIGFNQIRQISRARHKCCSPHHHPLLFCADQNQNVATKSQHSCASRPNLHTSTTHQAQHNTSQRRMQGRSSNPCRCCNSHQRGSCWAAVWRIEHRPAEAGPAAGCGRVESTAGSGTTCSNGRTARRCVTNSSWSSAFAGC